MLIYLWAESHGGVIGYQGHLPWHLPADMHYFKTTTTGHTVIAGAKTFASFGRPLPHRTNVVVSHRAASEFPAGVTVLNSLAAVRQYAADHPQDQLYVVGGAQLFAGLMPDVDRLYRTTIDADFPGDTRMPAIDYTQFAKIGEQVGVRDAANPYDYVFEQFERR
ncbi:dihydrofolate reductase [Levilactobacillus zymae]|uniref:Dihydrofolate reductase n=1 Tax=Levilactobacillus zymae TaxID=267363 RepID=A0A1Y6JWA3_9LACO|nr:dihydrofolate reductase [Levilactobacillus zymae]SMS14227.1 Dihydrofolate reductase [Levilactobacillus zymae]